MHDFLLAKEIVDEVLAVAKEKKLSKISKIKVEIGQVALAHDGFDEHIDDISEENLQFGIESIAKGTILENATLDICKVGGDHWKLKEIEGE
ncbi:MAG TPA: hydrogenase/urease maturation nickel metallochaperone HypA [Patescibacteria group bacterium]